MVQAVSRMECMASWGLPKSSTRSPSREAKIGPMVVPQGESFRTMRSWGEEERFVSNMRCVFIKAQEEVALELQGCKGSGTSSTSTTSEGECDQHKITKPTLNGRPKGQ